MIVLSLAFSHINFSKKVVSEHGSTAAYIMEVNGNAVSISQPLLPIFKGDNYEYWSLKMKTLF